MAADAMQIDENGFLAVVIGGQEVEIDVYQTWNEIIDLRQRLADEDRGGEFLGAVATVLRARGFDKVSHYAADKFVQELNKRVNALGKDPEAEQTRGSASTTARAS